MKLMSVVCRVEDEMGEHLHNIDPSTFMDLLAAAVEGNEPPDELAELQAELDAAKKPAPVAPTPAAAVPKPVNVGGMVVLPRAAAEPIVTAKTRGEVYEKLDELLSQFNARLATEGE